MQSILAFMQRIDARLANLQWDDVRLFLALVRSRTLGEAAELLQVDGSTVSRRLAALEENLAASLFDRGRSGVTATPAADALMPIAEEIEHAMARFAGAAESLEREVTGLVRIACPPDAAEVRIVPHLPELLGQHPGLRVDILAGESVVDVSRRAADIAVRVVRPETGDLIVRTVDPIEWVVAASPALAKVLGTVRRLGDVPWVTFGDRYQHIPIAKWVATHTGGDPVVRSDSLRVQIAVVAAGLGAAMLPGPSVPFYGLVPVKLAPKLQRESPLPPASPLYLLTHRALRNVPRVKAVWEFLLEQLTDC